MASNSTLGTAKAAKNDEFYTQLPDIEHEMQAYVDYDPRRVPRQDDTHAVRRPGMEQLYTILEDEQDPKFDRDKWQTHGRIFVLDRDTNGDNRIDIDDLRWEYLDGDGDFRTRRSPSSASFSNGSSTVANSSLLSET